MPIKILLADDNMTAQNAGRKILVEAGYNVVAVSNGAAALKKFASERPDVLVLDVFMPGYSGLEVCEKVKSLGTAPVLLTFSRMEPFRAEDGERVRANGAVAKPFESGELVAAVERVVSALVSQEATPDSQPEPEPKLEPEADIADSQIAAPAIPVVDLTSAKSEFSRKFEPDGAAALFHLNPSPEPASLAEPDAPLPHAAPFIPLPETTSSSEASASESGSSPADAPSEECAVPEESSAFPESTAGDRSQDGMPALVEAFEPSGSEGAEPSALPEVALADLGALPVNAPEEAAAPILPVIPQPEDRFASLPAAGSRNDAESWWTAEALPEAASAVAPLAEIAPVVPEIQPASDPGVAMLPVLSTTAQEAEVAHDDGADAASIFEAAFAAELGIAMLPGASAGIECASDASLDSEPSLLSERPVNGAVEPTNSHDDIANAVERVFARFKETLIAEIMRELTNAK